MDSITFWANRNEHENLSLPFAITLLAQHWKRTHTLTIVEKFANEQTRKGTDT